MTLTLIIISKSSAKAARRGRPWSDPLAHSYSSGTPIEIPRQTNAEPIRVHTEAPAGVSVPSRVPDRPASPRRRQERLRASLPRWRKHHPSPRQSTQRPAGVRAGEEQVEPTGHRLCQFVPDAVVIDGLHRGSRGHRSSLLNVSTDLRAVCCVAGQGFEPWKASADGFTVRGDDGGYGLLRAVCGHLRHA